MNRLVIIGNGFDLAHGLPTGYRDFIDDYWSNLKVNYYKDNLISLNFDSIGEIKEYKNFRELISLIQSKIDGFGFNHSFLEKNGTYYYERLIDRTNNFATTSIVEFNNKFFYEINFKNSTNWVDIENEYYSQLKKTVKLDTISDIEKLELVKILNQEFLEIKLLFENYLKERISNKYIFEHFAGESQDFFKILNLLKPVSKFSNEQNIINEFSKIEDKEEVNLKFRKESIELVTSRICFLNFNYTLTALKYFNLIRGNERVDVSINYIHGIVGNENENKINFGFGDEMDEDYKLIENINDNEYLRNFKSFQYLQNSNYSNLLSYIDSDKFQVLIMGHSCGLSDRTLLNTIFEHENCRSIKVFYHKKPDESDNYTDLIQNISRHFNDKKLMRSKIVNKTLSQPLPQIQLPKKE